MQPEAKKRVQPCTPAFFDVTKWGGFKANCPGVAIKIVNDWWRVLLLTIALHKSHRFRAMTSRLNPIVILLLCHIVRVAANLSTGADFSCAVGEDACEGDLCYGHVRCWGSNNKGQGNVRPDGA